MSRRTVDAKLCAETDDGYLVATVARSDGYFSVQGEIHNSRRAYELGTGNPHTCRCIHEDVLSAFPHLAPIVALHLCDVETGEPMHGPANGWYRLSGADMKYDLDYRAKYGQGNYHNAPNPIGGEGFDVDRDGSLNPAFVQFFVDMAARGLNCASDELSIWWTRNQFDAFVDDVLRPRWSVMAEEANGMTDRIAAMGGDTSDPSEPECEEDEFSIELDAGLTISAKLTGTGEREGIGTYFEYEVTITAPRTGRWASKGPHVYTSTFGGSVGDYHDGRISAREAAFHTARELLMFEHETARGFIEDSCGESWENLPAEQREALTRAEQAFDKMADALIANRETLGG